MNSKRIFLVIGLLALLLGIPTGIFLLSQSDTFHLGAKNPNQPENIQAIDITQSGAKIVWTTQKPTQSVVKYGLDAQNLSLVQPETMPATNHQITLSRLLANRRYYFVIVQEGTVFAATNNQPFNFSTLSQTPLPLPTANLPESQPTLSEAGLEAVMGTSNAFYDLNKDGIVNHFDLILLQQQL